MVRDGQAIQVVAGRIVRIEDRKLYYQADLVIPEAGFGKTPAVARPDKGQLEKLVADKVVSADDAKRVVRYEDEYWDALLRLRVLKVGFGDRDRFTVDLERDSDKPIEEEEQSNSVEVLRGKVVQRDDNYVYVLPEERCYELRLGASIEESLKKPLPREKVKELKEVAAN